MIMKKQLLASALALIVSGACNTAGATTGKPVDWSYTAPIGAENWGGLSSEYEGCTSGQAQSPIDIRDAVETEIAPLAFTFQAGPAAILNNGHTIQVSSSAAGGITLPSGKYAFVQMHFHTPSEEIIMGRTYPLNAHLVYRNTAGDLAVVALLFEEGTHNPTLEPILAAMPDNAGGMETLKTLNIANLLPSNRRYYSYAGSLTTPPCTEGVRWHVLSSVLQLSTTQLQAFKALYPMNARPIQPLNGRSVQVGG